MTPPNLPASQEAILSITRPHRDLWKYYLLSSLAFPPAFPFVVLPMWFRYTTMRYTFTAEGVSMRWGILFRKEVILQYARIQDIHLRSNIVERWLGLARVLVQTASGNANAEMTIEGLKESEAVRDFLYARMRGVKEPVQAAPQAAAAAGGGDELAQALREVAGELRAVRTALASKGLSGKEGGHV